MYRVELKDTQKPAPWELASHMFLMYRVELKVINLLRELFLFSSVPNVPCGVESQRAVLKRLPKRRVPNVPCGVERPFAGKYRDGFDEFLMYRVELKGSGLNKTLRPSLVISGS